MNSRRREGKEEKAERQLAFNDFNMEFIIISAATFRRRSSSRDHYQNEAEGRSRLSSEQQPKLGTDLALHQSVSSSK